MGLDKYMAEKFFIGSLISNGLFKELLSLYFYLSTYVLDCRILLGSLIESSYILIRSFYLTVF